MENLGPLDDSVNEKNRLIEEIEGRIRKLEKLGSKFELVYKKDPELVKRIDWNKVDKFFPEILVAVVLTRATSEAVGVDELPKNLEFIAALIAFMIKGLRALRELYQKKNW